MVKYAYKNNREKSEITGNQNNYFPILLIQFGTGTYPRNETFERDNNFSNIPKG
jgi:hypothetical protein